RGIAHSSLHLLASVGVRKNSLVVAERALPSHMENVPRPSCRAIAYRPVTLDCAAPALGEFPSTSAMNTVSVGLTTDERRVLPIFFALRVLRLMQSRPFMPYMKKAFPTVGLNE